MALKVVYDGDYRTWSNFQYINRTTGNYTEKRFTSTSFSHYFPETNDTFYCGFYMRPWYGSNGSPRYESIIEFWYDETKKVYVDYLVNPLDVFGYATQDDDIRIYRGDGTQLTSFTPPLISEWYVVLKVKLHATAGTVEMWINDTKYVNLTSQNTLNGTDAKVNTFNLVGPYGACEYANVYVGDTTGSIMNDQIGEAYVERLNPNADGTTNNWTVSGATNNWEAVNAPDWGYPENFDIDGHTEYNYTSTVGDKELYNLESMSDSPTTVYGIGVFSSLTKNKVGYKDVKFIVRSGTSETLSRALPVPCNFTSSGNADIYNTREYNSVVFDTDPNTSGAWTESAVNSCQIGVQVNT